MQSPAADELSRFDHDELAGFAREFVQTAGGSAAALALALERELSGEPLHRFARVWDLSASQSAAILGVSRQAYAKWLSKGVPAERRGDVRLLDQATQTLLDHVKVERVPAVVRRPAPRLRGRSLLDLAQAGRLEQLRDETAAMFDIRRVQP